jgi:AcrR family transcriptional regulator
VHAAWSPHGGGSGQLAEEKRERLVDAFTKVAAERGYAATEVEEVAREAGLSRAAFDAVFRDKRQCLLAAYDSFFDRLVGEIEAAIDPRMPWPRQVESGIGAALGFVAESNGAARLFAVEALSVGPPAIDRYIAAIERVVAILRLGRERARGAAALPELTEAVMVAGAVSLVTAALLAEEQERLPRFESELVEVLLLPYAGSGGAGER